MTFGKAALAILASFMFLGTANANRTFIDFNLQSLEGFNEATTQAMVKQIEHQILRQCQAISSFDDIELVSEKVIDRMVIRSDIFRSSDLVLRRIDKQKKNSYTIEISTSWDQDLPIPQADAQVVQSEYCKWKPY